MCKKIYLELKENWPKYFLNFLIFVIISFSITVYLDEKVINPNPEVVPTCSKIDSGIKLNLFNKGNVPAEKFNIIIYGEYGGGGFSYVNYELCKAERYNSASTLVYCDYIPPRAQQR